MKKKILLPVLLIFLESFFHFHAQCQTTVGGTISSNTTWTSSGNPYTVASDLIIAPDVVLTIKPGTIIKVDSSISIVVDGTLAAIGKTDSAILFSANTPPSDTAYWSGIYFRNDAKPFDIGSGTGCTFQHCVLQNGGTANYYYSSGGGEFTIFSDVGIYIDHCTIQNGYCGCTGGSSSKFSNNIFTNTISDILSGPIARAGKNSVIQDNIFYSNTSATSLGLVSANKNVKIFNNIFVNNEFVLSNSLFLSDSSLFYGNTFIDNQDIAIVLEKGFCYNNTITRNVAFNEVATISDFTPHFYNNNIGGNRSEVLSSNYVFAGITGATEVANIENNWWGTADSAAIAGLVQDQNDESSLCRLDYVPFLSLPDINSPMIPPFKALKKDEGSGNILLTWSRSKESDLKGYRIYYKNFTGYSFSVSLDAGQDTFLTVSNASMQDTFAVTAYDLSANGNQDQFTGHESWFTYATPDSITGIPNVSATSYFDVAPNPFHENCTIHLHEPLTRPAKAKIFTLYGTLVREFTIPVNVFELDRNGLTAGVYLLQISSGEYSTQIQKIIVQ